MYGVHHMFTCRVETIHSNPFLVCHVFSFLLFVLPFAVRLVPSFRLTDKLLHPGQASSTLAFPELTSQHPRYTNSWLKQGLQNHYINWLTEEVRLRSTLQSLDDNFNERFLGYCSDKHEWWLKARVEGIYLQHRGRDDRLRSMPDYARPKTKHWYTLCISATC